MGTQSELAPHLEGKFKKATQAFKVPSPELTCKVLPGSATVLLLLFVATLSTVLTALAGAVSPQLLDSPQKRPGPDLVRGNSGKCSKNGNLGTISVFRDLTICRQLTPRSLSVVGFLD